MAEENRRKKKKIYGKSTENLRKIYDYGMAIRFF